MTKEEYHQNAKYIWKTYVPKSGVAETIQGELLRSIEKLRDEAHRNGNKNWNNSFSHEQLALFIQKTLIESNIFEPNVVDQIKEHIVRILNYKSPETSDDIYDFITYRIVDWYTKNPTPISNPNFVKNPVAMTRDGVVGIVGEGPKKSELEIALMARDKTKVIELIKNGADIEEKDPKWSSTLLAKMAAFGYVDMIEVLLDYGANINAVDKIGQSVLDSAVHRKEAKAFLKSKGAKSARSGR